jgi:hypothetical protein
MMKADGAENSDGTARYSEYVNFCDSFMHLLIHVTAGYELALQYECL